jgi:predicted permease
MKTLLYDVRYALRLLVQNRTVTLVAMTALALGIGANTAIFSVINAVLLTPLPYHDPGAIVTLLSPGSAPVSGGDFNDIKTQARSFEAVAAAEAWGGSLTGGEKPEQVVGLHLSDAMFQLLGVPANRGRTFLAEDFEPGKENVLVLSYGLWQRRFGGASDIAGKSVTLDGASYNVVGIMPPRFQFAPFWITQAEMWAPLQLAKKVQDRGGQSLRVFGRLRTGVTAAAAQRDVDGICRNLARAYPETDTNLRVLVERLDEKVAGNVRPALLVMLVAVGLVLLIACANVANLVLARAAGRQREIAIRLSLGARRTRIVSQFLTESVVLALAGAVPALFLAAWGTRALHAVLQPDAGSSRARLPNWNEIGIDIPVLLFTLALAAVTGILFGIAPAILASKTNLNSRLKEGGRSMSGGHGSKVRKILVASEVALAIVLLVGAGLLMRTFLNLRAIDAGFDPHNVLAMNVSVTGQAQYVGAGRENLYRSIVRNIEAVPGVRSAALINHVPLAGDVWGFGVGVEGRPMPSGQEIRAVYRVAGPKYFATMRVPVLKGREFDDHDTAGAPPVIIVNETFARQQWPRESAIGKRIAAGDIRRNPKWRTIVGIIKDAKQGDWTSAAEDEIYVPLWQTDSLLKDTHSWMAYIGIVVRTDADAAALTNAVRNAVWSIDRNLPVSQVETLEHAVGNATWQWRFNLLLIGIFAVVAMTLAVVGIYGVMAYEVAQRTHEIGIRMALGAGRGGIVRLVFGQSFVVVVAGVVVGIGAALALARLMTSLLFGVKTADPVTFVSVAVLVLVVAAMASLVPARRATTVDPVVALRWE